jgi:hypothetical protein
VCLFHAASTNLEAAAAVPPMAWDVNLKALELAALFRYEAYPRACLYGDPSCYATSASYKAPQTRDNQWVVFQHHIQWCAPSDI